MVGPEVAPGQVKHLRILRYALQGARHQAGLSQAQLAARAGISEGYVAMLETGSRYKPSWKVVAALASACSVGVVDLVAINEVITGLLS